MELRTNETEWTSSSKTFLLVFRSILAQLVHFEAHIMYELIFLYIIFAFVMAVTM